MILLVCGVSGSGKSTLAAALSASLGIHLQDADALHPPSNVEKMRAGTPLDDADRAPWLAACGAWLASCGGTGGVLACSALKRRYRDVLRAHAPTLRIIYLDAGSSSTCDEGIVLGTRIRARQGHYMPPSLLDSQYAALEPPGADEGSIAVDVSLPLSDALAHVRSALGVGDAKKI